MRQTRDAQESICHPMIESGLRRRTETTDLFEFGVKLAISLGPRYDLCE